MAKKIKNISKKQLVNRKEFIKDYIGIKTYKGKDKITHHALSYYLLEMDKPLPKRLSFDSITEEDLRKGKVIYVRDKKGYIIPYENPHYVSEDTLFKDLNSENKESLEQIRRKELANQLRKRRQELEKLGFVEDNVGNIISFEEIYYEKLEETFEAKQKRKTLYKSKIRKYKRRDKNDKY